MNKTAKAVAITAAILLVAGVAIKASAANNAPPTSTPPPDQANPNDNTHSGLLGLRKGWFKRKFGVKQRGTNGNTNKEMCSGSCDGLGNTSTDPNKYSWGTVMVSPRGGCRCVQNTAGAIHTYGNTFNAAIFGARR